MTITVFSSSTCSVFCLSSESTSAARGSLPGVFLRCVAHEWSCLHGAVEVFHQL